MRESNQALAAFVLYRDMGPDRTIAKVAAECHKSVSLLNHWSQAHRWGERVRSHDQAIADDAAKHDRSVRLGEMDRLRKRRLATADKLRTVAGKVFDELAKDENVPALIVRPSAVMRMVEHADRIERLDTGEPTERIDVTKLTDEEILERIARLERPDRPA